MEKCKPHYQLDAVKAVVSQLGKMAFTRTGLFNSLAMGLSGDEAIGVVLTLSKEMFYKSMTTHTDHTLWQDVYHAPCLNGKTAYVKITLRGGAVIIQFKER
jgi:motility quorum-sensing regulator/GCU-specific mRNA interferase toxin